MFVVEYETGAEVAEQADALRSGRSGLYAHVGSTPTFGTISPKQPLLGFFCGPVGYLVFAQPWFWAYNNL